MEYYDDNPRFSRPRLQTDRSMWKMMLLSILTLGIYNLFFFMKMTFDLNRVIGRNDGEKTWNYALAWLFALVTGNIIMLIWHYGVAARVERELARRKIEYEFSTTNTYWGWYFFGSFIVVGTFVYMAKLCRAMNLLCDSYNQEQPTEEESKR